MVRNEFMGKEGQTVPEMSDEWITTISNRYIELYEKLTGSRFEPSKIGEEELRERILESLQHLSPGA